MQFDDSNYMLIWIPLSHWWHSRNYLSLHDTGRENGKDREDIMKNFPAGVRESMHKKMLALEPVLFKGRFPAITPVRKFYINHYHSPAPEFFTGDRFATVRTNWARSGDSFADRLHHAFMMWITHAVTTVLHWDNVECVVYVSDLDYEHLIV